MPSLRVMSALAVAALGPQPVRSFLMPTGVPSAALSRRRGGQLTGTPTATTPFRARVSRSRNQESRRGALMMAKKKGGTKKKGNTAGGGGAAAKKKSAKTAGGAGGVGSGSGSAATVVEAPAMSAAEAAATSVTAVVEAEHNENLGPDTSSSSGTPVIQNRTSDAEPVADVNGSSASAAPTRAPASKASEGASKGFGAPVAEPKAAPKKSQQQQKQQQQQQRQAAGGVSSAGPPVRQGVGGLDALAPGVPVAGNTDHQKVVTDLEFTEPDSERVLADSKIQGQDGQMSPAQMLQYLQDNNLTIDLETMNPVEIPKDSASKMEAIFPYPAANVKAEHSLGANPKPSQFANAVIALLPQDVPWDGAKIRELPELKDFLTANRLHGGDRGMKVITTMMLKAMSTGDVERAKLLKGAAICMTKAENALTGPFRQAVMFAENRLAPCMGSTVCEEYAGKDGADAAATWVVLKACVAEWEQRLREVRQEDIGLHDIFRAIPSPTEDLDEERTAAITGSVQAMGVSFGNNDKLMKSLPAEVRFMEGALGLNTTTEVRRYALQEFCPQEGVSPEDLRFRVRSLVCGLDQLQAKSYHQLQIAVGDVYNCLAEGTAEDYNIYLDNWEEGEGLTFETYRVDTGEKWRNRLRDIVTSPVPQLEEKDDYEVLFKEILPKQFWGLASSEEPRQDVALPFKIVKKGWWDSLDFLDAEKVREKQARADAIEAARFKDPDLRQPEDKDPEMNDIFSDFLREEQAKLEEYNFNEADFEGPEFDPDIPDGPGPGMEEVDLGFGDFDDDDNEGEGGELRDASPSAAS